MARKQAETIRHLWRASKLCSGSTPRELTGIHQVLLLYELIVQSATEKNKYGTLPTSACQSAPATVWMVVASPLTYSWTLGRLRRPRAPFMTSFEPLPLLSSD